MARGAKSLNSGACSLTARDLDWPDSVTGRMLSAGRAALLLLCLQPSGNDVCFAGFLSSSLALSHFYSRPTVECPRQGSGFSRADDRALAEESRRAVQSLACVAAGSCNFIFTMAMKEKIC